jgi:hypothetical protein
MPKTYPRRLYREPMLASDAARTIERVALILQNEADRMHREVNRLKTRRLVPRGEVEERLRIDDMRIPRVVHPDNAKQVGRLRKAPAENTEA